MTKNIMQKNDLQQKTGEELRAEARDLSTEIAQKAFAVRVGGEQKTHTIRALRKKLARVKTLLRAQH